MNTASSGSYMSYLAGHNENPYHLNHIYEFAELSKRIALESIAEVVPPMIEEVCLKVIKDFLNGNLTDSIKYDITSIATLNIGNFNKMIQSKEFSTFISEAVADEIRKRIDEINLTIKI